MTPLARPQPWRKAGLIALAVAAGVVGARVTPSTPPEGTPLARYQALRELPVAGTHSIELDLERSHIRITGPDPYIVLQRGTAARAVRAVRLRVRPVQLPADRAFVVYFVPQDSSGAPFSERWTVVGDLAMTPDWWTVRWPLPAAAGETRVDFPEGGEYEFGELAVGDDPALAAPATGGVLRSVLVLGAGWLLVLLAVRYVSRVPSDVGSGVVTSYVGSGFSRISESAVPGFLLLSLLMPVVVMTFLLPPFQGPDEDGAWKLALVHYRPSIRQEPALFYLPDLMNAVSMKFRPAVHMGIDRLRLNGFDTPPPAQAFDVEYRAIQRGYKYGQWYAYPAVWVVGLFYPTVANVQQALVFYYLCRLATGFLLIGMLEIFRRRYDLPVVAIAFFALPAVVQQFVVVSVDTTLNVATIAAVLLFLRAVERRSIRLEAALLTLVTMLSLVKFTYVGLLLLPLGLIVRRRARVRPAVLVGAVMVLAIAAVLALRVVLALSRDQAVFATGSPAAFDAQVAALTTWYGWRGFVAEYWWVLKGSAHPATWAGPLGWLDTPLSPQHLTLITGSLAAAAALDLWNYRSPLLAALRNRRGDIALTAAIVIGAFAIASFVNSLVFYVITTPVGAPFVAGMQGRHLFYAGIVAVLLPVWIVREGPTEERTSTAWQAAALVILGLLLTARTIELAIDLMTRYW